MKPREYELLRELADFGATWARPMDVGGSDGSHHSATLARLFRRGWLERRTRSAHRQRPAHLYKITHAGMIALEVAAETSERPGAPPAGQESKPT